MVSVGRIAYPRRMGKRVPRDSTLLEPVGVFLDVDLTLTDGVVQEGYAKMLGCESEFRKIERDWGKGDDKVAFNQKLVPLFAAYGLTMLRAKQIATRIPLQAWVEKLLDLPATRYIVSSGPSYYNRWLADQYGIPQSNVVCSEYSFNGKGGVISGFNAVDKSSKAEFVMSKLARHSFTIGVGNSREDLPFLSKVTLPIMTSGKGHGPIASAAFLSAPTRRSIPFLIEKIIVAVEAIAA